MCNQTDPLHTGTRGTFVDEDKRTDMKTLSTKSVKTILKKSVGDSLIDRKSKNLCVLFHSFGKYTVL